MRCSGSIRCKCATGADQAAIGVPGGQCGPSCRHDDWNFWNGCDYLGGFGTSASGLDLSGPNINRAENLVCMNIELHEAFDALAWGLEGSVGSNGRPTYTVRCIVPTKFHALNGLDGQVLRELRRGFGHGPNAGGYPIPAIQITNLHLAIVKIRTLLGSTSRNRAKYIGG